MRYHRRPLSLIHRVALFILHTQLIIFAVNHSVRSSNGIGASSSFLVQSTTNVKWTANQDPNAPLASKVPRSQKYWDENNIERPDYAKTDAEIAAERKKEAGGKINGIENNNGTTYTKVFLRISIASIFLILWTGIYRFGMMGKGGGTRLGNSNSASSSSGNALLNYSERMKKITHTESLEEKTRKARLARFELNEKNKDE